MGKREAEEQITKDGSNSDHNNDTMGGPSFASSEVMSRRKILQPRGKSFTIGKVSPESTTRKQSDLSSSDFALKAKALANSFANAVGNASSFEGVPDLRPIASKYLTYYQQLEREFVHEDSISLTNKSEQPTKISSNDNLLPTTVAKSTKIPQSSNFPSIYQKSDSDQNAAPKKEEDLHGSSPNGPAFLMPSIPTTKKSVFSFDKKPAKKIDSSDSESEVEIRGPVFTFDKKIDDPNFKMKDKVVQPSSSSNGLSSLDKATVSRSSLGAINSQTDINSSSSSSHIADVERASSGERNDEQGSSVSSGTKEYISGEENETVLFQKRCKLMLLDTNNKSDPYLNLGIGEVKVLRSDEKSTSRILMRADGSLRVLLNVLLMKDVTYTTIGNGSFVRVPAINENKKIETYVLKFKAGTEGEALCKILNEAKST